VTGVQTWLFRLLRVSSEYGIYLCGNRTENAMRYGLMDGSFVQVLPAIYDSISVNSEGIAAAQIGDRIELYAISNGGARPVARYDTEMKE
jgi:hypothetical protein